MNKTYLRLLAAAVFLATVPALVGDANFACIALQMDVWLSRRAPTFAYEFNDDAAPWRRCPRPFSIPTVIRLNQPKPHLLIRRRLL